MNSPIAEPMVDNEALRFIVSELRTQNNFALGRYDSLEGAQDIAITDAALVIRSERPLALRTVVTNQGANPVSIFENSQLVNILATKQTWVSPMSGQGIIKCQAASGQTTTVAIATFLQSA